MHAERTNEQWLQDLQAQEPHKSAALAALRQILHSALANALKSRVDVMESMLDDFVQDSLIRILDSLPQFAGRSRFVTWAITITLRVAYTDLRRRHWKEVSLTKLTSDARFDVPVHDSPNSLDKQRLIDAMHNIIANKLTEKQRTLLLAEIQGMAQVEIARQMGMQINAVYKFGHDARSRLKKELELTGFNQDVFTDTFLS